jgi:hypothetical protein
MLGAQGAKSTGLFITGSQRELIPNGHVLVRVDRVLDLSWLRGEVADCYCCDNSRPGIDPEVVVRLMLETSWLALERAFTARPRHGTDLRAPSGAASPI